ncbi:MAG TPA: hypothetical protein VNN74_00640 [Candidatus Micrarchaeia archaeon]|nr:hypothetical protein [Candidatus Micrarchaeia archaeon]
MDPIRSRLVNPGFAHNPPVKLNIDAKTLGLVIAVLSGIGVLLEAVGLLGVLSLGAAYAAAGFAGIAFVAVLGLAVDLAAALLGLVGGWRMAQANPTGKPLVIYGLALGFLGEIVVGIGYYAAGGAILGLIVLAVLYYLVVISRFPGEGLPSQPA